MEYGLRGVTHSGLAKFVHADVDSVSNFLLKGTLCEMRTKKMRREYASQ